MKLTHPFAWLSESLQKTIFIIMFPATLIVMYVMGILGNPLKTAIAPGGIVDYELAGTLGASQAILKSWGETERLYAGLGLGFDFVYIICYSITIALGCGLVAHALSWRIPILSSIGFGLAWTLFMAGILDGIENYSLVQLLLGAQSESLAIIARWCAIPKFAFVALGLLYVGIGTVLAFVTKPRQSGFK